MGYNGKLGRVFSFGDETYSEKARIVGRFVPGEIFQKGKFLRKLRKCVIDEKNH